MRCDELIGGGDDMGGGAIVFDEILDGRLIVLLEAMDEAVAGAAEGIDVLIVVADGKDRQAGILVLGLAAGEGADQCVLALVDVLVLVDQNVAIAGEQSLAQFVAFAIDAARRGLPLQQGDSLVEDLVETLSCGFVSAVLGQGGETRAGQTKGQGMVGEHGHRAGFAADEIA
ncbi:MAG: hypothetical protein AW10_00998 [Candidatus Accumulibacter appositus]|uniref:Uncharacterized protein n=1 Tax=Candidatus Accumulibacter appositus TaxID=1454003 RepID=A0A011P236_9PROT|nr:MAG: hypothetical protein AW10_00998 [Candidatus Accumulibacter appositus]